jgi:two-component system, NtrC family, sensor histidine kinase PilS
VVAEARRPDDAPAAVTWRPLAQLCVLRIVIAGAFLILGVSGPALRPLGARDLDLFNTVAAAYLVLAVITLAAARLRWPAFRLQAPAQVAVDVVALTVLMHASGGVESGLGILLVPAVAGGALLLPQRQGLALAALGTVAVFGEHFTTALRDGLTLMPSTQAALLGAGLFGTALIAYLLASRARRSALQAEEHRTAVEQLTRINAEVIQRMQTGVIVAQEDGEILTANPSAERLTGAGLGPGARLGHAVPALGAALARWHAGGRRTLSADAALPYAPRFAALGGRVLIFLEDTAALHQQAQLLKLAGLGRLAASIAHQIRNPLAAIRQSAALLGEELDAQDPRTELVEIVQRQTERLVHIVDEVLALGRPRSHEPRLLDLEPWLDRWADEYRAAHGLPHGALALACAHALTVRFDPGHLQQALGNLVDNALVHAPAQAHPRVRVDARSDPVREVPLIEVTDSGPGIAPGQRTMLFEPFYTTRAQGTGLGLYLVRQLCEANQARVEYFEPALGGAGFRIVCADPRRAQYA